MVGEIDICAMGVLEEQQRRTWQTCVNIVEIYKRHIRQKSGSNVPNPKGEPFIVMSIPMFVLLGTKLEDTRFCT